jgi:hypothetical protein
MNISRQQIQLRPGVDSAGHVFHFEGNVYRAISKSDGDFYRKILDSGALSNLFHSDLIETCVADIDVDGYDLILQHRAIEFPSVWSEWCSLMIKEAALLICRLNLELAKRNLFTKDTQPGNILFDYTKPVWIDFGSIVPLQSINLKSWFRAFWRQSISPLWLLSKGKFELGRAMYTEVSGRGLLQKRSSKGPFRFLPFPVYVIYKRLKRGRIDTALQELLAYLTNLQVTPSSSSWLEYGQGGMPSVSEPEKFKGKNLAVYNVLRSLPPGTLLDIACNKGWYATLAASLGHRCVAFDLDDAAVCRLFQTARARSAPILPLVIDFTWPTPSFGIALRHPSAIERLRCDTTLALAIMHHLVFKRNLSFEAIVETISLYTKKAAIIEFVPREDRYVAAWIRPEHSWYTLDQFIPILKRRFTDVSVHDEPSGRKLLFCRKPLQ